MKNVILTKTGHNGAPPIFGSLEAGTTITFAVPDVFGERSAKMRALQSLKRSNPDENGMEWSAEVVSDGSEANATVGDDG